MMRCLQLVSMLALSGLLLLTACGGGSETPPPAQAKMMTIESDAAFDGYLVGNPSDLSLTSAQTGGEIRVGDANSAWQPHYRGVVRFHLDQIPANAQILSAKLEMVQMGRENDPYGKLGPELMVDHLRIPSNTLVPEAFMDFDHNWGMGVLARDEAPRVKELDVTASLQADLTDGLSTLDLRLRFPTGDNGDYTADYVEFASSDTTSGYEVPKLVIEYIEP